MQAAAPRSRERGSTNDIEVADLELQDDSEVLEDDSAALFEDEEASPGDRRRDPLRKP